MSGVADDRLSHVGPDGTARMVDVSDKPDSTRVARATGRIRMKDTTLAAIVANQLKKGDVFGVARVAGIMAAKRTADLIPLCHPLPLTDVQVVVMPDTALPGIRVEAVAKTVGKTGVEMEALAAATVALLTVYDMAKGLDRAMVIEDISLAEKSGGASGDYART
ncbi:MAG TPA: cyclic pyranopterin monophosphate synthase MoaC [Gemmatimonadaceae bacterium]